MINLSNKLLTSIVETQLAEAGRMSVFARVIMLKICLVAWYMLGLRRTESFKLCVFGMRLHF